MKKDKVDEALEKMAESLRRLEKNGDIDSFVVIAQRKTGQKTDGMTAICVANERYLMTWAAALARAVAHRGHHSPKRVAQDLYNIITNWRQYEKEHEVEAWGDGQDDGVH